jgi:hypothetical protein
LSASFRKGVPEVVVRPLILLALTLPIFGCSTGTGASILCPGCGSPGFSVTYTGSFAQNAQPAPVQFTGIGQVATVTVTPFHGNISHPYPPASVTGAPSGTCTAVTIQNLPQPNSIEVQSVAHGQLYVSFNDECGRSQPLRDRFLGLACGPSLQPSRVVSEVRRCGG